LRKVHRRAAPDHGAGAREAGSRRIRGAVAFFHSAVIGCAVLQLARDNAEARPKPKQYEESSACITRQGNEVPRAPGVRAVGRLPEQDDVAAGYIEGEYALLASPYAGQLQKLFVRRGDQVEVGKPVFALEPGVGARAPHGSRGAPEERAGALENLQAPRRAPEVAAARRAGEPAKAAAEFSRVELARQEELMKQGYTTRRSSTSAQRLFGATSRRVEGSGGAAQRTC